MKIVRIAGKALLKLFPVNNESVYRFGRALVDRYNGDNNCNILTNGELRFIRNILPGAKVVFDVGANVGDWTKLALNIEPNAEYHCFEPSAETFEKLYSRIFPPNVIYNHFALGECAESRYLHSFGDGSGINSLYIRQGVNATQLKKETIKIISFDDYCSNNSIDFVDFVKLDVEGHEFAVLKGARRMLSEERIRAIQFEYGGTYIDARVLLKDIMEFIHATSDKYAIYKIFPDQIREIPIYKQSLETFQYSNWAIILKD